MKRENLLLLALVFTLALTLALLLFHIPNKAAAAMVSAVKDSREEVQLPVLMYHGLTDDASETGDYFITAETLEADLQWLADHGYTAVTFEQLADYAENGAMLPEKPVLLTFDDGYYNNYSLAFPLLKAYNVPAVISVIGSEADLWTGQLQRPEKGSITWGEAADMADSGLAEIGSHTYDLHRNAEGGRKGADKLPGEDFEEYRSVLLEDLGLNQQKIEAAVGKPALVFAWPYGAWPTDGSADAILKELGFKGSLTSYQIMNTIRAEDPDSLFGLKRFLRTPDFKLADHLPS